MLGGGKSRERLAYERRQSVFIRGLAAIALFLGGWACELGLRLRPDASEAVTPLMIGLFVAVVPAILATMKAGAAAD